MVNVTIYGIHGSYGYDTCILIPYVDQAAEKPSLFFGAV